MEQAEFKPVLVQETQDDDDKYRSSGPQSTLEEGLAIQRRRFAKERMFREALSHMRVPARYLDVPLGLCIPDEIDQWQGAPWSVTILGPTGSGKTWLAVRLLGRVFGVAQHDINTRGNAQFMDASAAIEAMRAEISGEQMGTLNRLSRIGGLLIDDYGAERGTEFANDRLSLLLRQRYNSMLPTILTSNLESLASIEPRIASRLSSGIVLQLKGSDRRLGHGK